MNVNSRNGGIGLVAAVLVVALFFGVRMCFHFVGESGGGADNGIVVKVDSAFVADSMVVAPLIKPKRTSEGKDKKKGMRLRSPLDEPVASE